jgi:hypothetical protein
MQRVWLERVEEVNLGHNISVLRKALGHSQTGTEGNPRWIAPRVVATDNDAALLGIQLGTQTIKTAQHS